MFESYWILVTFFFSNTIRFSVYNFSHRIKVIKLKWTILNHSIRRSLYLEYSFESKQHVNELEFSSKINIRSSPLSRAKPPSPSCHSRVKLLPSRTTSAAVVSFESRRNNIRERKAFHTHRLLVCRFHLAAELRNCSHWRFKLHTETLWFCWRCSRNEGKEARTVSQKS